MAKFILPALIILNIALLITLICYNIVKEERMALLEKRLNVKKTHNFDDLVPSIIYSKDESVEVVFKSNPSPSNSGLSNCINPNVQTPKLRLQALKACLPLLGEYRSNSKKDNKKLLKDVPNFVPKFGEAVSVVNYPFDKITWKQLYKSTLSKFNILNKLNFYKPVPAELYDYDPSKEPNFSTPHLGIFNSPDYCNVHDILIQHIPNLAIQHKYFVTDYHHMGLPRMFVIGKIGEDLMPKISKNMNRLNYYQNLYSIDYRANHFFLKGASFHFSHEFGKNFGCFGQSYNHIPGHGAVVRKDLLNKFSNEWMQRFENNSKCNSQLNFFIKGFRLYDQKECINFFNKINSEGYEKRRKTSPYQYIMKVGYGVHRGAGVELLDEMMEKNYREQFDNGKKCGTITENVLAQHYIDNPLLFEGHKFDFRIYMLISSVNPLKVYYHDGFLRVSLVKYFKTSHQKEAHMTNTELSKAIIKKCEKNNEKYDGKTADELRDFQMKSLEDLQDYLLKIGKIKDKNWVNNYLRKQFQRAFISTAKMIENRLFKNSNLFEIYGVDFVIDDDLNLSIVEINASPMIVGTAARKTKLMTDMLIGLFNITFAQQYSRTKRTLRYLKKHKQEIEKKLNISKHRRIFEKLYQNHVSNEYKPMLENNPWKMVYDGELVGDNKYLDLLDSDCVKLIE